MFYLHRYAGFITIKICIDDKFSDGFNYFLELRALDNSGFEHIYCFCEDISRY